MYSIYKDHQSLDDKHLDLCTSCTCSDEGFSQGNFTVGDILRYKYAA